MRHAAFWLRFGRGACGWMAAGGLALTLAGCSGNTSRFDFPVLNLANSDSADSRADPNTTSSIPVPPESIYASAGSRDEGRISRATLPPPAYTPRPAKDYTPPPSGRIKQASYTKPRAPEAEPMVERGVLPPPQGRHIQVAKGDTLSSLSRQYDVSVEEIMSANNLPDGHLHVGQELVIPGARGKPTETKERVAPPAIAAKETKAQAPNEETKAPTPKDKRDVHVVKTTTIPAPGTSLAEEEAQQAAKAGAPKKDTPPAAPVAASNETTGPSAPGPSTPSTPHVATNEQLPAPDPMSGNSFRWPVKGRVVSGFGTKPDGGHNDGIDLAVPQGTSVMAAENGVVAYAGNELKGYGNLILIRHANNWVSAYAHNEEILVKRGDKVRRGQIIAKAGATGSVSQPQVHFELRKGSRPVDPTKFMGDQAATAN
jgi:murein DD-endopeptidase MepM/ murein hydrolase activator NlpD